MHIRACAGCIENDRGSSTLTPSARRPSWLPPPSSSSSPCGTAVTDRQKREGPPTVIPHRRRRRRRRSESLQAAGCLEGGISKNELVATDDRRDGSIVTQTMPLTVTTLKKFVLESENNHGGTANSGPLAGAGRDFNGEWDCPDALLWVKKEVLRRRLDASQSKPRLPSSAISAVDKHGSGSTLAVIEYDRQGGGRRRGRKWRMQRGVGENLQRRRVFLEHSSPESNSSSASDWNRIRQVLRKARDCGQVTDNTFEILSYVLEISEGMTIGSTENGSEHKLVTSGVETTPPDAVEYSTAATLSANDSVDSPTETAFAPLGLDEWRTRVAAEQWYGRKKEEVIDCDLISEDERDDVAADEYYDDSIGLYQANSDRLIFRAHPWYRAADGFPNPGCTAATPADPDTSWQNEAISRDLHYRKSRISENLSEGISAGLFAGQSPLDSNGFQRHGRNVIALGRRICQRRELPPLKISEELVDQETGVVRGEFVKDLNMPGFIENLLRKQEFLIHTPPHLVEWNVQQKARIVRILIDSVCRGVGSERELDSFPMKELKDSLDSRQEGFILHSSVCEIPEVDPHLSKTRRLEASDLYKRLARALDQRVPPNQRLFQTTGRIRRGANGDNTAASAVLPHSVAAVNTSRNSSLVIPNNRPRHNCTRREIGNERIAHQQQRRNTNNSNSVVKTSTKKAPWWHIRRVVESQHPVWMRASASKILYGLGTDIFPHRFETRLRDYDPYKNSSD